MVEERIKWLIHPLHTLANGWVKQLVTGRQIYIKGIRAYRCHWWLYRFLKSGGSKRLLDKRQRYSPSLNTSKEKSSGSQLCVHLSPGRGARHCQAGKGEGPRPFNKPNYPWWLWWWRIIRVLLWLWYHTYIFLWMWLAVCMSVYVRFCVSEPAPSPRPWKLSICVLCTTLHGTLCSTSRTFTRCVVNIHTKRPTNVLVDQVKAFA